ncbi:MAG: cation diffusion facilitator family transporter [Thermoanaerobaculum sp.]
MNGGLGRGFELPASVVDKDEGRGRWLARALRLEFLTVGWNILEGFIALVAAWAAGSIVLAGFGFDSFVESTSGAILIWRLWAERKSGEREDLERLDRRAHRLVGASMFVLAAYVGGNAAHALLTRRQPEASLVGIVLTVVSIAVMLWLARAKLRAAESLASRALEADAFQTTACWWLSLITLSGLALNSAFGWWWADPVAALGMLPFLIHEGLKAFRGEASCTC